MSSALLSVLLVQQHVMYILIGPHIKHFSDGNQTVCATFKKKSWLRIMPKQRERCLSNNNKIRITCKKCVALI
jgi:hypothetical protein